MADAEPLPFRVELTYPKPNCPEEEQTETVVTVRMDGVGPGWEQWVFFRSDAHHESLHCDQELEKKHLEQAKARGALIFDFGDMHDGMQGRGDKRADKSQVPRELRESTKPYLQALLDYNFDFYKPYAERWVLMARGNHETALASYKEADVTAMMAERFQALGSPVQAAGEQGWVRFMFTIHKTLRQTAKLRYTHGYGGGGPVTKDVIQANRQMAFLGDMDFLVSGHTHDKWHVRDVMVALDPQGKPQRRDVDCIKVGTYKDDYGRGRGWAVSKGMGPKPLGGWWVRFFYEAGRVEWEVIEAK